MININRILVPAIDARQATVTLTASTSAATKQAHKHITGTATALSGAATSPAKPKGEKGKHAGKGYYKHPAACNATLAASNSTISVFNCTLTALNSTLTTSNSTLTVSNSTIAASNITEAAQTGSYVNASAPTTTPNAKKYTGAKVATEPTAQSSANELDDAIEELAGLDFGNVARDLPTRESKEKVSILYSSIMAK